MVTSLSSALRSARMEIEYLTPCETAPAQVCIHGAQVLDLALSRLRELGRRATENEAGLHQQLAAGAKAVATLNGEIARAQALIHEKTFRITELEDTVETLKSVVGGYAGNVERLEDHVQRAQHDACEAQAVYARQLAQKEQRLQALNAQLASARQTAGALGGHVAAMATRHECVLAERDARLGQLRGEIERLAGAVKQLRRENGTLKTRLQERQPLADAPSQSQNQQQHQHQQHHLQNQNHLPTPKMDSAAVFGADGGDAMDSDEDMGVAVGKRRAFAYQRAQADSVMAMGCDEMR
jgi:chromosome segregation ATPase